MQYLFAKLIRNDILTNNQSINKNKYVKKHLKAKFRLKCANTKRNERAVLKNWKTRQLYNGPWVVKFIAARLPVYQ